MCTVVDNLVLLLRKSNNAQVQQFLVTRATEALDALTMSISNSQSEITTVIIHFTGVENKYFPYNFIDHPAQERGSCEGVPSYRCKKRLPPHSNTVPVAE